MAKPSPEQRVFWDMRNRRNNPNNRGYRFYGGRGIRVCDEWDNFATFYADMGPRPSPTHSLDRIDNDGNYCKDNCRWATKTEQANNRRERQDGKRIELDGESLTVLQWSRRTGLSRGAIEGRLRNGWRVRDALTKPPLYQR